MFFLFIFLAIFFLVVITFAFPRFSPIPYYPTNWGDIEKIIKVFPKDTDVILDLGAGSGTVIFALARDAYENRRTTQFFAFEINPFLVLLLHIKNLFHPNRQHVRIQFADLFKIRYSTLIKGRKSVFYLYVSPRLIPTIVKKIKKDIPLAQIVSYMYEVKNIKASKVVRTGNHPIYLYTTLL